MMPFQRLFLSGTLSSYHFFFPKYSVYRPIISGYLACVCGRIWQAFAISSEPQTCKCSTALILLYIPTRRKTAPSGVSVAC